MNINHPLWQAKRCWKCHPNALSCAYRQSSVVLLGGDVELSCNVHILHGHQALVLAKGLFHYLNGRGHIVGFVVTPIKQRHKLPGNSHNWQCLNRSERIFIVLWFLLISENFHQQVDVTKDSEKGGVFPFHTTVENFYIFQIIHNFFLSYLWGHYWSVHYNFPHWSRATIMSHINLL